MSANSDLLIIFTFILELYELNNATYSSVNIWVDYKAVQCFRAFLVFSPLAEH